MAPARTLIAGLVALATSFSAPTEVSPRPDRVGAVRASGALATRAPASVSVDAAPSGYNGPDYGSYAWPVRGAVLHYFEPPATPYASGHRGIDIGASFGSSVVASNDGTVAFSGWIGGSLFISIDHPDGIRTTYSWLADADVRHGDTVTRGEPIGKTGHGHPELSTPHLHFGARLGANYLDPMLLLEGRAVAGLIHLAPLPFQG